MTMMMQAGLPSWVACRNPSSTTPASEPRACAIPACIAADVIASSGSSSYGAEIVRSEVGSLDAEGVAAAVGEAVGVAAGVAVGVGAGLGVGVAVGVGAAVGLGDGATAVPQPVSATVVARSAISARTRGPRDGD